MSKGHLQNDELCRANECLRDAHFGNVDTRLYLLSGLIYRTDACFRQEINRLSCCHEDTTPVRSNTAVPACGPTVHVRENGCAGGRRVASEKDPAAAWGAAVHYPIARVTEGMVEAVSRRYAAAAFAETERRASQLDSVAKFLPGANQVQLQARRRGGCQLGVESPIEVELPAPQVER